jgi:CheY-like chemotaxis protein
MANNPRSSKVLVIDDDPDIGILIERILRNDDVRTTTSGLEGLTMAETDPPDLIILDLSLPDAIVFSGSYEYEICRRLKANPTLQNIPILLTEAFPPTSIYPEAQRVGASGYILKPFSPSELVTACAKLLQGETYYPLNNT